ncbi:MAG TPA: hypothetical protein VF574_16185 [Allosphingosinicella sp.]|jgi:hypothetical protein
MSGERATDEAPASPGEVLRAGFIAAAASATAMAAFGLAQDPGGPSFLLVAFFLGSFFFGLFHAWFIAIPAYLLLRRKWPLTRRRSVIGGLVVGGLPWGLFTLSIGAPWPNVALTVGMCGAAGAIGGMAFAAMLRP